MSPQAIKNKIEQLASFLEDFSAFLAIISAMNDLINPARS